MPRKLIHISELDSENLSFGRTQRKKASDAVYCEIKYNPIHGPKMIMGSDIIKHNNDFYVDLVFDKTSNNKKLLQFIEDVDRLAITEIYENHLLWYPQMTDDLSLLRIEHDFIPTVKPSTVYTNRKSLKLKIPCDHIELYDHDRVRLPYKLVKEKCEAIPILNVRGLKLENEHICVEWEILQLMVSVDVDIKVGFRGCVLHEEPSESEPDATPENSDED